MKNLKLKLTLVGLLISSTGIFAQKFYISADAGYAFAINGDVGEYSNIDYTNIDNDVTHVYSNESSYEAVPFSLGKGFNFGGAFGYMFTDNIGFELGFSYLQGSKTTGTRDGDVLKTNNNGDIYNQNNKDVNSAYSQMFRITPTLVITPGFEKINPYGRFGAVVGFGSYIKETEITMTYSGTFWDNENINTQKEKFEGGTTFGINAVIGLEYVLNDNLSLFGEVNYIGMRFTPSKSYLTESTYNGDDQLPGMNTYSKETEYYTSKTVKTDSALPIDNDSPKQVIATNSAFNSLGLNFGVKLKL